MSIDPFPGEQGRIIRELQREVARLSAIAGIQQPLPIVSASGAFVLPEVSTPDPPPSGVAMYAVGGELRIIQSNGVVVQIPAADVAAQDPLLTDVTAPASYSSTWGQRVRDDLVATRAKVFELQTSFRGAAIQQ